MRFLLAVFLFKKPGHGNGTLTTGKTHPTPTSACIITTINNYQELPLMFWSHHYHLCSYYSGYQNPCYSSSLWCKWMPSGYTMEWLSPHPRVCHFIPERKRRILGIGVWQPENYCLDRQSYCLDRMGSSTAAIRSVNKEGKLNFQKWLMCSLPSLHFAI